ncbi:MAG: PDZ domain-containing protein [Polyangiales bacterium]
MSRWWKEFALVALAGAVCGTAVPRLAFPPTAQARGLRPTFVRQAFAAAPPSSPTPASPHRRVVAPVAVVEPLPPPSSEPPPESPGVRRAEPVRGGARPPEGLERARGRWVMDLRGVQSPRALLSGMDLVPPGEAGAPDDGYVVRSTDRAGYARAAGIRPGDVLVSANGHALRSPDDALDAFIAARRADRVSLDFRRGAQRYTVQVQLLRGDADLGG